MGIKESLLKLSEEEKKEREAATKDFLFYLGECDEKERYVLDKVKMGQSWLITDDLDYEPSQIIDNKIKPLICKQARFMFGRAPDILFKPYDKKDKKLCEELRQYIDSILNASRFWSNTLKAFRLETVTKKVMLRMEANPGESIRLFYHALNDFNYEVDPNDVSKLKSVTLVKQDSLTSRNEEGEQIWYRYNYYLKSNEDKESSCFLKLETFKGSNLDKPIHVEDKDTLLSKIPCWVIVNEQSIGNANGFTDIKDLRPLQDSYNRRLSDFNDALRFLMFGQTVIVDATDDSVNDSKIAPNAMMALVSLDGNGNSEKKAQASRLESSFANAEPVDMYLTRLENSMYEKLSIPRPEQLAKIPSAKALKYLYTELIARCDEKWNDWEPSIRSMLRLIIEANEKFKCYEDWKSEWNKLKFSIVVNKQYPIPEDEEDSKKLAMEEVRANVRSHKSYIKDFSSDEDYKEQFDEIIDEISVINAAEQDQYSKGVEDELNDNSGGGES